MSALSELLRDEIKLVQDSKRLGVPRQIDHDKALLIFRRCAEEIEALETTLEKASAALDAMSESLPPLGDSRRNRDEHGPDIPTQGLDWRDKL
jgi:hypothetical protein